MKPFIELGARIAAVIQNVCANVDLDVVSLPGGSLIAIVVWLCALRGRSVLRYSSAESPLAIGRAPQHQHHPPAIDHLLTAGARPQSLDVPATIDSQISGDRALDTLKCRGDFTGGECRLETRPERFSIQLRNACRPQ
jgi:hypothetical protein